MKYFLTLLLIPALLFSLLISTPLYAAVAFDAVATAGGNTVSSLTFSHTTTTSADRVMVVWTFGTGSPPTDVSGVTYNGVSLTFVNQEVFTSNLRVKLFRLVAPATGTNNVVVTITGGGAGRSGAISKTYTGVDQTTPLGTFAGAQGTSTALSVNVSSATGELVSDGAMQEPVGGSPTFTVGASQTQRANYNIDANTRAASSEEAGAATTTMTWSSNTSLRWVIGGVPIKPAGVASPTEFFKRRSQGM